MSGNKNKHFNLEGKTALVTGSAEGIGMEIALGLARYGADIILSDINITQLDEVSKGIESIGRKSWSFQCDNSQPEQIRQMFKKIDQLIGVVDVLVNNVGIIARHKPIEMPLEDWERVLKINLTGTFICSQEAGTRMIERGLGGSIINISSIAGWTALGRGNLVYSVSKSGINQLTRELAIEWAKYNIRVNAILPSQIRTTYLQNLIDNISFDSELLLNQILKGIPLNRIGEPEDIVGPVIFLASDASAFITGIMLPVDGGNLAMNAGGSKDW
jgi:NAD(P)-dependent dehydrogenase (short-subunit alcohol dehydrogenase family)